MLPTTLDDILFELRALHFTILTIKLKEMGLIDEEHMSEYIEATTKRLYQSYGGKVNGN